MTREELEMRTLVRESDVIDRTDGSELAKAFNYLWEKYVEQEPCGDVISREATLMPYKGLNDEDTISVWLIRKNIEQQPPVNPQSKTGHWIDDKCSIYGKGIEDLIDSREWYRNEKPNFCPFCGLKLIKSRESEGKK